MNLHAFLCAPSVFSVPLWWIIRNGKVNHRDTENTELAQRKTNSIAVSRPINLDSTCYNSRPMPPYPNLVSDSTLVQETIDLLRLAGGRAEAKYIVDAVFKVSHIDDELAGQLVGDLVKDDRRFRIIDGKTVELQAHDFESELLNEIDFVVVDVEATGAKLPPNRLIELGAYRIHGRRIVDEFVVLVNPEIAIPRFVVGLTGINNDMVKSAPLFADVAPRWLEFVKDAVLIAHNSPFDTNFLNHEISRVYPGHRMINTHLCTVTLSRRVVPGLTNYKL